MVNDKLAEDFCRKLLPHELEAVSSTRRLLAAALAVATTTLRHPSETAIMEVFRIMAYRCETVAHGTELDTRTVH